MNEWQEKVWAAAEELRARHLQGELARLPVDVFSLAELELRLDVIPFDDLFAKFEADAAITSDFTGIYVDAEAYYLMERGPEWKLNRLRFSYAHEIGHLVLHRDAISTFSIRTLEDFMLWSKECGGQRYQLEREANELAGRLLVPRERFIERYEEFAAHADQFLPHWRLSAELRRSAAERIAPRKGVKKASVPSIDTNPFSHACPSRFGAHARGARLDGEGRGAGCPETRVVGLAL